MPTYEYECKKCGLVFEKFQSMRDPALKKCPKCRGAVKRLLGTGAGIIFKGSGFYETDYKRKSGGGGRTAKSSPPADAKPADTKPAEAKTKTTAAKKD